MTLGDLKVNVRLRSFKLKQCAVMWAYFTGSRCV